MVFRLGPSYNRSVVNHCSVYNTGPLLRGFCFVVMIAFIFDCCHLRDGLIADSGSRAWLSLLYDLSCHMSVLLYRCTNRCVFRFCVRCRSELVSQVFGSVANYWCSGPLALRYYEGLPGNECLVVFL